MDWMSVDLGECAVAKALDVVGRPWTLLLLREAFNGVRRFDHFATHLGVSRPVLTRRLRELVDEGLFERVPYREGRARARHGYRPTPKAWDLYPVLIGLMQWGDRYYTCDEPALKVVEGESGEPVKAAVVPASMRTLEPGDLRLERHGRPL